MRQPDEPAIIGQPYGGLGDNLQLTTLPGMFAERGIPTYLSAQNLCRNRQMYDLTWGLNPHLKGIKDAPPNITIREVEDSPGKGELNTVQRAEMMCFGKWTNQYPMTFYQPRLRPEFADKFVLEFGYVTVDLRPHIEKVRRELEFLLDGQEAVLLRNPVNSSLDVGKFSEYRVTNIWELADILWSCKAFAGVESGAAVLCATMKRDDSRGGIYVFCRRIHQAWKAFVYPNQTILVVG